MGDLRAGLSVHPGTPLGMRVPVRDEQGRALSDFMLIVPGFNRRPSGDRERIFLQLNEALRRFDGQVVFADLNLKLNILWISLQPGKGVAQRVIEAIRETLPEARLVANQAEVLMGEGHREGRFRRLWRRLAQLGGRRLEQP